MTEFHVLRMENAQSRTVALIQVFFARTNIIYYKRSPPQSPDLNQIELVWSDLKDWLATLWKPSTKAEFIVGIEVFWREFVTVKFEHRHFSPSYLKMHVFWK